jgi:hypothetical protein
MLMSLQQKYAKILSEILPAGLVGASLLLGSVVPSSANQRPQSAQPLASDGDAVAQRLAAVRAAVSAMGDPAGTAAKPGDVNLRLAWGNWNNWGGGWGRPWGGWGWPNWNNWRNWNNWNNWWRNW